MIEELVRKDLLTLATTLANHQGRTLKAVSFTVYGRSNFLDRFEAGEESPSLRIVDKMLDRFAEVWPADLPWPKLAYVRYSRR